MKPTLLILAAGMGSRYGGNKQTDSFGPNGETIMDYSIYDAIRSGFGKIVFVIRDEFAADFKTAFNKKLDGKVKVEYVMQDLSSHVGDFLPEVSRSKPWGTAHAVLCAKEVVHEPFAVINADDFYGRDAFDKAYRFLTQGVSKDKYCIVGYQLPKTLSENGTVSRGVCSVDEQGNLTSVQERTKIYRDGEQIVYEEDQQKIPLSENTVVSMNFWCFHPEVLSFIDAGFKDFLKINGTLPKSEYFLTTVGDSFIQQGGKIEVVTTNATWFGVTYKEDAPDVKEKIRQLIEAGYYPENLWDN